MNRREALGLIGFAAGMATMGNPLVSLFRGLIRSPDSQASPLKHKALIHIYSYGSPPRWHFDQFLNPFGHENYVPHPRMATEYKAENGRYTGYTNRLVNVKGIQAPPLWLEKVSRKEGAAGYEELLDNLLSIQGFDVGSSDHASAGKNMMVPNGWDKGVTQILAEAQPGRLPPVAVDCAISPSAKGAKVQTLALSTRKSRNALERILRPFECSVVEKNPLVADLLDQEFRSALGEINRAGVAHAGGAGKQLMAESEAAIELFRDCVTDLEAKWKDLYGKYEAIVSEAIDYISPGINDMPIGVADLKEREAGREHSIMYQLITSPDLRDSLGKDAFLPDMAAQFAVAEYLTLNRLTSSVTVQPAHFAGVKFMDPEGKMQLWEIDHDQHRMGAFPGLYLNHFYFRALGACVVELTRALKKTKTSAGSLFDDVLIQLGSEFNRVPNERGGGWDHGWNAASVTYLSGSIRGPMVLGRVVDSVPSIKELAEGTVGVGAGIPELSNQTLNTQHLSATTLALLGAGDAFTEQKALVHLKNGKAVPRISKHQVVSHKDEKWA